MSLDVDDADSNPWIPSVAHYSAKEVNARSCAWSRIASVVLPGWVYMSLMAFPLPDGRQAYLKQSRRHRTVEVEVVNRESFQTSDLHKTVGPNNTWFGTNRESDFQGRIKAAISSSTSHDRGVLQRCADCVPLDSCLGQTKHAGPRLARNTLEEQTINTTTNHYDRPSDFAKTGLSAE